MTGKLPAAALGILCLMATALPSQDSKTAPGKGSAVSAGPINRSCPVNGAGIDPKYEVSVEGKTIAFCSRICCNRFLANMSAYLPGLPGFETKKPIGKKSEDSKAGAGPAEEVLISSLEPRGGVRRSEVQTRHYRIYLEKYDPAEVAELAERAYAAWTDFFGREPQREADISARLVVKAYATSEAYVEGGRQDKTPTPTGQPNMGMYWTGTGIAHFYAPDGEGALRFMLLHEGTHQFHFKAMTGNAGTGPDWYVEGLAYWFSASLWDPKAKTLKLGGTLKAKPLAAPVQTLAGITSDSASAISFLATRYPLQFRQLAAVLDQRRGERAAWREAFGMEEAPPEFLADYTAWCASRAEGGFPGWGTLVAARAIPAAVRIASWALASKAPASLGRLKEAVLKAEEQNEDVASPFEAGIEKVVKDLKGLPAGVAPQAAFAAAQLAEARAQVVRPVRRAGLGLGGSKESGS